MYCIKSLIMYRRKEISYSIQTFQLLFVYKSIFVYFLDNYSCERIIILVWFFL
jgi:hypothetical protein